MLQDLCKYSIYSLQFYFLFPLATIGQLVNLPGLLNYLLALTLPLFLLNYFAKLALKHNYITLVKHHPEPDHPHTTTITLNVIIRSAILGAILSVGLSFVSNNNSQANHLISLGIYIILLSFFHFSEFFVTSLTNPSTLHPSSFLIEHSSAYLVATSSSFLEYMIEVYFFPQWKQFNLISLLGLTLALGGEAMRKIAMFTAGQNFSHTISSQKDSKHQLVKHGIYKFLRHPSYAGWFYWAVGTQIMLQNPICTLMFTVISCRFFRDRIIFEETTLVRFFGSAYEEYRKSVGLWMPIQSY